VVTLTPPFFNFFDFCAVGQFGSSITDLTQLLGVGSRWKLGEHFAHQFIGFYDFCFRFPMLTDLMDSFSTP
jgi:hypothetical protein